MMNNLYEDILEEEEEDRKEQLEQRQLLILDMFVKLCQQGVRKQLLIVEDKVIFQYLLTCVQSNCTPVVEKSLWIMEALEQNRSTHQALSSSAVSQALIQTGRRHELQEDNRDEFILQRVLNLYQLIKSKVFLSSPVQEKTTEESKSSTDRKMSFLVHGLTMERKGLLTDTILRVTGVVSIVVDVPHLRCVVMGTGNCSADHITIRVAIDTPMTAIQVVKNRYGKEVLERGLNQFSECDWRGKQCDVSLPEYLPDCESPTSGRGILSSLLRCQASSWVKTTSDFLQEAFYW